MQCYAEHTKPIEKSLYNKEHQIHSMILLVSAGKKNEHPFFTQQEGEYLYLLVLFDSLFRFH